MNEAVKLLVHVHCHACSSHMDIVMTALDAGTAWQVTDRQLMVWHQSHYGPEAFVKAVVG